MSNSLLLTALSELTEARKNPELNPKRPINQLLFDWLKNTKDTIAGCKNVFVSFTSVEKIGINPTSNYPNTPYGIYSYPLEYVLSITGANNSMETLPWFGERPYVNVIKMKGNIVNLKQMSTATVNGYITQIKNLWSDYPKKEQRQVLKQIDNYVKQSVRESTVDAPGGRFWYIAKQVAFDIISKRNGLVPEMALTRLLRSIEIDGVVDGPTDGLGIIHAMETTQAVAFSIANVTVLARYHNVYSPEDVARGQQEGTQNHTDTIAIANLVKANEPASDIANAILHTRNFSLVRLVRDPQVRIAVIQYAPQLIRGLQRSTSDEQLTALVASKGRIAHTIPNPSEEAFASYLALPSARIQGTILTKLFPTPSTQLQLAMCSNNIGLFDSIKHPSREAVNYTIDYYLDTGTAVSDFPPSLLHAMSALDS